MTWSYISNGTGAKLKWIGTLRRREHSHFFTSTATAAFPNVVLAQGACCVDVQPLINASTVEMVPTREFVQLCTVIICRKANTTLLHRTNE
uniref:Uncharacterized protein n=1 Tax=Arundo donax TaxID=35708 RepID=A0A0A9DMA8_ARUDO